MTQLASSKPRRLRRRSILTVAAVAGVAASFLALTALRAGPADQNVAQLTGSSTTVVAAPTEKAAANALAGKGDLAAVAPSKPRSSEISKPDSKQPVVAAKESTAAAPSAKQPAAKPAKANPGASSEHASSPSADGAGCAALSETVDVFLQHFYAAHLERSPGGQVTDILDLDQYILTHTVMIEDMLKPQLDLAAGKSVDVFLAHLYAAHLERSLEGQVADIGDLDQYVLTHTVMVEDMLKPIADGELASC